MNAFHFYPNPKYSLHTQMNFYLQRQIHFHNFSTVCLSRHLLSSEQHFYSTLPPKVPFQISRTQSAIRKNLTASIFSTRISAPFFPAKPHNLLFRFLSYMKSSCQDTPFHLFQSCITWHWYLFDELFENIQ